jgi:hypothetical protein
LTYRLSIGGRLDFLRRRPFASTSWQPLPRVAYSAPLVAFPEMTE